MKKRAGGLLLFIFLSATVIAQNELYKEKYRPQFHFYPARGKPVPFCKGLEYKIRLVLIAEQSQPLSLSCIGQKFI